MSEAARGDTRGTVTLQDMSVLLIRRHDPTCSNEVVQPCLIVTGPAVDTVPPNRGLTPKSSIRRDSPRHGRTVPAGIGTRTGETLGVGT